MQRTDIIRSLMVSTSYPKDQGDWRGLFIRRLAEALARHPEVSLRLWNPPGDIPPGARLDLTQQESAWLGRLMADGGIAHLLRTRPWAALFASTRLLASLRKVLLRNNDTCVYHINWVQNAIALPANGRPALITALGTDMQLLRVPFVVGLLRRTFRQRNVAICPNARWMVPVLEQAFGDVARIEHIPFGIDPRWFALRRAPNHASRKRWLVVSRLTRGKLGPLFEWCQPLFEDDRTRELHLFGPLQEMIELPKWVFYHGPTTPAELCNQWFPTAEGLITLSKHAEGRPQVMLEAMAAGLPIIASRIPAHEDILRHGRTGWLCNDSRELADGIDALEGTQLSMRIGQSARDWVAREIGSWDDCAKRYIAMYRELATAA